MTSTIETLNLQEQNYSTTPEEIGHLNENDKENIACDLH